MPTYDLCANFVIVPQFSLMTILHLDLCGHLNVWHELQILQVCLYIWPKTHLSIPTQKILDVFNYWVMMIIHTSSCWQLQVRCYFVAFYCSFCELIPIHIDETDNYVLQVASHNDLHPKFDWVLPMNSNPLQFCLWLYYNYKPHCLLIILMNIIIAFRQFVAQLLPIMLTWSNFLLILLKLTHYLVLF